MSTLYDYGIKDTLTEKLYHLGFRSMADLESLSVDQWVQLVIRKKMKMRNLTYLQSRLKHNEPFVATMKSAVAKIREIRPYKPEEAIEYKDFFVAGKNKQEQTNA